MMTSIEYPKNEIHADDEIEELWRIPGVLRKYDETACHSSALPIFGAGISMKMDVAKKKRAFAVPQTDENLIKFVDYSNVSPSCYIL
ncbi:unnamed protein product [Caenorhabditis angaria]|uniref:Uncharacterized protein n=1 Tax=Caenorhabditis angaria TaxID=860376 RepID=A0A9P1ILR6_9PELO|nr:unnamed protein product [Caenorhabditis angaria]